MDLLEEVNALQMSLDGSALFPFKFESSPLEENLSPSTDCFTWNLEREDTGSDNSCDSLPQLVVKSGTQGRRRKTRKGDDGDFEPTLSEGLEETPEEEVGELEEEEEEQPARASRKTVARKRKTATKPTGSILDKITGDSVVLSRESLLTISSVEFEVFLEKIAKKRHFTEFEEKEVRRQRRLIKNRESAAQSRNRKKQLLDTLESENSKLRAELEAQKKKWAMMESVLEKAGQLQSVLAQISSPMGGSRKGTSKSAGLMFVLVLSFGLLLGLGGFGGVSTSKPVGPQEVSVANLRQLFSIDPNLLLAHCANPRMLQDPFADLQHKCNLTVY